MSWPKTWQLFRSPAFKSQSLRTESLKVLVDCFPETSKQSKITALWPLVIIFRSETAMYILFFAPLHSLQDCSVIFHFCFLPPLQRRGHPLLHLRVPSLRGSVGINIRAPVPTIDNHLPVSVFTQCLILPPLLVTFLIVFPPFNFADLFFVGRVFGMRCLGISLAL